MDDLDIVKRDRFELLSTYLDNEASVAERKQVEQWLITDPEFRQLYRHLLIVQRGFQALPTPPSTHTAEQTAQQVMARVTRRSRLILWGLSTATAAAMVSAMTSLFSGGSLIPETAQSPTEFENNPSAAAISNLPVSTPSLDPSALMLALDRPPVEFPMAMEVVSPESVETPLPKLQAP
jgi:anti-sigma factor RsiW